MYDSRYLSVVHTVTVLLLNNSFFMGNTKPGFIRVSPECDEFVYHSYGTICGNHEQSVTLIVALVTKAYISMFGISMIYDV